jgi:alpha-galactosidase
MSTLKKSLLKRILLLIALLFSCAPAEKAALTVAGKNIRILFDNRLYSRVEAVFAHTIKIGDLQPSEYLTVAGKLLQDFALKSHTEKKISNVLGKGRQHTLVGEAAGLQKEVMITVYEAFPTIAVMQVKYTNTGDGVLQIDGWTNHHYSIQAEKQYPDQPPFWTYQPATYEERPDWVLPIKAGFSQDNYLGMNASDYGGGTPVGDIWRPDVGIGVGHLEMAPKQVSLPVQMKDNLGAELAVHFNTPRMLKPGESLTTFTTFVAVHQGDYFQTLTDYRALMMRLGITFRPTPATCYEPQWCAWGYERKFTMDQVVNTLPKAKQLGFQWAVLDDGWQTAEGDWYLDKKKFPRGEQDMIDFVQRIKADGLKPQLWWSPLAVDPGTDLIKQHADYLLLNQDGSTQKISWWDAYYLCPAYQPVVEFTRAQVETFMRTWGFQGLKIDGQHLNAAPPCYNPAHHHAYPEEACEKMPDFFKMVYETALSIYPDAVVEICPCGTSFSFFTMPYMNQSVASDPESSWQTRLKCKTLKALMGPDAAYYGDHVELSDGGDDFASQIGIGAVIGTKFTWPVGAAKKPKYDLTPAREKEWAKWTQIYLDHMLSTGTYLGLLYDLGFDRPETHAIKKDNKIYYAFYADKFSGAVELRGLGKGAYKVRDYVNEQDLGTVSGPVAKLPVSFTRNLLLEAIPK